MIPQDGGRQLLSTGSNTGVREPVISEHRFLT